MKWPVKAGLLGSDPGTATYRASLGTVCITTTCVGWSWPNLTQLTTTDHCDGPIAMANAKCDNCILPARLSNCFNFSTVQSSGQGKRCQGPAVGFTGRVSSRLNFELIVTDQYGATCQLGEPCKHFPCWLNIYIYTI